MLVRIACTRCHLASLWTDDPQCFLATVCNRTARCEATLLDEDFGEPSALPAARPRRRSEVTNAQWKQGRSHEQRNPA